ncbi:MAG: WD40 repeat domain-containing protein [Bacteroidia bacterium]
MNLNVNKIETFTGHNGAVYAIDSGASDFLFYTSSGDKYVALWSLKKLQAEKFAASFPSAIYSLKYVFEKNTIIVGTTEGKIHVIDLNEKKELKILQNHSAPVFDIKYSIKTNCFYTTSADGCIAVCSLENFSVLKIKKVSNAKIRSIDFSPVTDEMAVASGDGKVYVLDLYTLNVKKVFSAHQFSTNSVKFSPDGTLLLTGGRDAHLNVWSTTEDYILFKSIPAHNFAIYDIVFSPDGLLFATASRDKTIKIWDAITIDFKVRISKENYDGHVNSVNKLLWTTYNKYLVSVSDDRAIMVWDISANDNL